MTATLTADVSATLGCWADDGQHLAMVTKNGNTYVLHAEKYDSSDEPPEGAPDTCNAYNVHVMCADGTGCMVDVAPCWSDCEHEGHLAWLVEQADDAGLFEGCHLDPADFIVMEDR